MSGALDPTRAPFEARVLAAHPHGVLRVVSIAGDPPPAALARLLPEERALVLGMAPLAVATWVAGRIALGEALDALGAPRTPLLSTARGAPVIATGFVGSVSHKKSVAVALAARDEGASVGVDVEDARPHRYDISRRVLTDDELAEVDALSPDARALGVALRFSIKESIYKALDPFVQRYVGFKEAVVDPGPPGEGVRRASARLELAHGEGPFSIEATWMTLDDHVVTTARMRRA